MKQVVQHMRSGQTAVIEVPAPNAAPGTALVRNAASLVSAGTERMLVDFANKNLLGKARARPDLVRQTLDKIRRDGLLSTLETVRNRLDEPLALGYSSAGVVVEIGEGLEGFSIGDRVACAGGGYAVHAEYVRVPRNLLAHLPETVDFEAGAFTTLGAIALHGFRLGQVQIGERVAVIGLGLLGLLSVGIARAAGCKVLGIDLDPARVALAQELGAEAVLRPEAEAAAQAFSTGQGYDAILICADTPSNDPVELAGILARDRARVAAIGAVGLDLPRKIYFQKELEFVVSRSYGPGRYDPAYEEGGQDYPAGYVRWTEGRNLKAFVDLLATGRLDVQPLISHRFPIEDAPQAYELISNPGDEAFLAVLLRYPDPAPEKQLLRRMAFRPSLSIPDSTVRLGALGAGNFARTVLFPILKKNPAIELVGLASAAGLHGAQAGARFGFAYTSSDESEILSDERINTVAVLTRHHLHTPQTAAALQAGKHVFCEKPLAIDEAGLQRVMAALEGSQQLLCVGFNRRFAPLALAMQRFLSPAQAPKVIHILVNAGLLPPEHWLHDPEQGGGRIIGEGCHFIDFAAFLAGAAPDWISAQALPDQAPYRQDNVVLNLGFADGSLATIHYLANGDRSLPKEYVEVFCAGRVARLYDFRRLETAYDGRQNTQRLRGRQDKGHTAIWETFAEAIRQGGPPPIPYPILFAVTQASFDALRALRAGERIPIRLPDQN